MTDESKGPSAWALKKAAAILSELCHEEDVDEIAWIAEEFESAHAAGRLEERERAAKICDEIAKGYIDSEKHESDVTMRNVELAQALGSKECAFAIRREPDADGE